MDLTDNLHTSLERYFTLLSKQGYINNSSVNKLIIMLFIEEILTGPMSLLITSEDYDYISKAITCLHGDCLMPYNLYESTVVNINKTIAEDLTSLL